jgi:hypothetical protein
MHGLSPNKGCGLSKGKKINKKVLFGININNNPLHKLLFFTFDIIRIRNILGVILRGGGINSLSTIP